jgi:hypothetical protein
MDFSAFYKPLDVRRNTHTECGFPAELKALQSFLSSQAVDARRARYISHYPPTLVPVHRGNMGSVFQCLLAALSQHIVRSFVLMYSSSAPNLTLHRLKVTCKFMQLFGMWNCVEVHATVLYCE